MFPAERRREIERLVNSEGAISITKLSDQFGVSEMTIHRDLKLLEDMGSIEKTRGGAVASRPYVVPTEYRKRLKSNEDLKSAIGRKAVEFIQDGDTIYLDPGTTSLQVARALQGFSNLTVYTNGPAIVVELSKIPGVEVYCTGGLLSKSSMAFVGPDAERTLSKIRPERCFVGAHALTIANGVSDPFPLEASLKRRAVEVSQEVYLIVTPDKFGNVAPHISVPLEAIDIVITNEGAPEIFLKELEANKLHCVLAPSIH
jgi:DeoR/GlpR family transcriptional regulator of sugar metabolism